MGWRSSVFFIVVGISVFVQQASAASLVDDFLEAPIDFLNRNFTALIDVPEPDFSDLSEEERAAIKDIEDNTISLNTCVFNPGISEPWVERLSTVALYYNSTYKELNAAGYPESVWLPKLHALVIAQVNKIAELLKSGQPIPAADRLDGVYNYEVDLYNSLVTYANSHGQEIVPDEPRDWCGGDFIGFVRVQSAPPNATILLLSEFSFKLCKSQGKNAYSDCLGWTEASPNNGIPAGPFAINANFRSLMHFAWLPISGVSMPQANGMPPPRSRMSCPSQRTVSPSTAVSEAHVSIAAIIGGLQVPCSASCTGNPPSTTRRSH